VAQALGERVPPPDESEELAALLRASRELMQEMQDLGAELRRLAAEHTALAKRHSALVEAMRQLTGRGPRV